MRKEWLIADFEPKGCLPDIPHSELLSKNIKAIILDVDETILPRSSEDPSPSAMTWIQKAKANFNIHLLSNNPSEKRISSIGKKLGIDYTFNASKPRKGKISRIINSFQCDLSSIAIIGDRVFTDILLGNRIGIYTILVSPIDKNGLSSGRNKIQNLEKKIARLIGQIT